MKTSLEGNMIRILGSVSRKFKNFTPTQIKQINKNITGGTKPYKAIAKNYFKDKWGSQTTHINSLVERIERGGFQGIPFLLIGGNVDVVTGLVLPVVAAAQ